MHLKKHCELQGDDRDGCNEFSLNMNIILCSTLKGVDLTIFLQISFTYLWLHSTFEKVSIEFVHMIKFHPHSAFFHFLFISL